MALPKAAEQAKKHIQTHNWSKTWTTADYRANESVLHQIHSTYQECLKAWNSNKKGFFPEQLYQIRNGGLSESGAYIFDDVKSTNNEPQTYQVNEWMLDKYRRWITFSMTEEEKAAEYAKCRAIHATILKDLRKFGEKVTV